MNTYVRVYQYGYPYSGERILYKLDELGKLTEKIEAAALQGYTDRSYRVEFVQMTEEEYNKLENAE